MEGGGWRVGGCVGGEWRVEGYDITCPHRPEGVMTGSHSSLPRLSSCSGVGTSGTGAVGRQDGSTDHERRIAGLREALFDACMFLAANLPQGSGVEVLGKVCGCVRVGGLGGWVGVYMDGWVCTGGWGWVDGCVYMDGWVVPPGNHNLPELKNNQPT